MFERTRSSTMRARVPSCDARCRAAGFTARHTPHISDDNAITTGRPPEVNATSPPSRPKRTSARRRRQTIAESRLKTPAAPSQPDRPPTTRTPTWRTPIQRSHGAKRIHVLAFGSSLCPPAEAIDLATIGLRRSTSTAVADQHIRSQHRLRRRAVVYETPGRDRSPNTLLNELPHFYNTFALRDTRLDSITDTNRTCRLRRSAVQQHTTIPAELRRSRTRRRQTNGPEPGIDAN